MTNSMTNRKPPQLQRPSESHSPALHRGGAVARMLGMPVATLRVWERRYSLTPPSAKPGGQRLYSADDVRRLALIKQLTDLGHAIGRLAPLAVAQLQAVADTHAQALAAAQDGALKARPVQPPAEADRPWRLVVVGPALAKRLQRPAFLRTFGWPLQVLGPFESVVQAGALVAAEADALLLHEPQLHSGWLDALRLASPDLADLPRAVLYGYAAEPVCEALAAAGTALLREPQPDVVVAQWLRGILPASAGASAPGQAASGRAVEGKVLSLQAWSPPRWSDAALADFAGLSSTIACECPRHVAELLMQLTRFEKYSAECLQLSPADAAIHASLRGVAAASRTRFEAALEQVARHEGLPLPLPAVG